MKKIEQVKAFHKLIGQPVLTTPTIPSIERCNLRYDLIREELEELREAFNANDKVEILDALCDLRYVLDGSILEFGMQDVFNEAFNDVHESNMSKECENHDIALRTSYFYERERDILTKIETTTNGKYKVVTLMNGKVLKSIEYKPVDLTKYV